MNVDEQGRGEARHGVVPAVGVIGGVIDPVCCDRVQMNQGDGIFEVCLAVDHAGAIAALPPPAKMAAPAVGLSRNPGLELDHGCRKAAGGTDSG